MPSGTAARPLMNLQAHSSLMIVCAGFTGMAGSAGMLVSFFLGVVFFHFTCFFM